MTIKLRNMEHVIIKWIKANTKHEAFITSVPCFCSGKPYGIFIDENGTIQRLRVGDEWLVTKELDRVEGIVLVETYVRYNRPKLVSARCIKSLSGVFEFSIAPHGWVSYVHYRLLRYGTYVRKSEKDEEYLNKLGEVDVFSLNDWANSYYRKET